MTLHTRGRVALRATSMGAYFAYCVAAFASGIASEALAQESGAASKPAPTQSTAVGPRARANMPPPALYGKWHQDNAASTAQRQVFVPVSVELGQARFRQTLDFQSDGRFIANVLAANDAHSQCAGSFVMTGPRVLAAKCAVGQDEETRFAYRLLQAKPGKLVLTNAPIPQNPYLRRVQARRRVWEARKPQQYAFVYDISAMMKTPVATQIRVEVIDGRVVSARGTLYGGDAMAAETKTMDGLFDLAEKVATFGEGNIPASFKASYGARGHLSSLEADARTTIADDETGLRVACFDSDVKGCAPRLLSSEQCGAVGGWLVQEGTGCDRGGWSIGLVANAQACCRTYSAGDHDELTLAQCTAVGGSEQIRGPGTLAVGSSQKRGTTCQRRFVGGPSVVAKSP